MQIVVVLNSSKPKVGMVWVDTHSILTPGQNKCWYSFLGKQLNSSEAMQLAAMAACVRYKQDVRSSSFLNNTRYFNTCKLNLTVESEAHTKTRFPNQRACLLRMLIKCLVDFVHKYCNCKVTCVMFCFSFL